MVKRVDGIAFRRHVHAPTSDEWLGVDGAIQLGRGPHPVHGPERTTRGVHTRSLAVGVVGGPGRLLERRRRDGRRDRRRRDRRRAAGWGRVRGARRHQRRRTDRDDPRAVHPPAPPHSGFATLSLARLRPHLMAVTAQRRPLGARPPGPRPPRGAIAWPLRPLLLVLIMAAAGVFVALTFLPIVGAIGTAAKNVEQKLALPPDTEIQFPRFPQRSTIFAEDGTRLATLYLENRKVVHLDQIARVGRRAVLAIEDYQFFHHGAIDVKAIVRAALANLRAGHITQGGSTISQQLVKNITGQTADTLIRKVREAQLAVKIEQTYSKKEILELYLNEIYLGNGAWGMEAASQFYFGHHASQLTLPEAAMLAGMISNPSQYDPLGDPTATQNRRNVVLDRMAQIGWISPDKASQTEALPLGLSPNAGKPLQQRQPFHVQVVRKLIEENKDGQFDVLGKTKNQRVHALYQGGLSIYTTLNPAWESTALDVIKQHLPLSTDPQSAIATVEPGTGAVRVLVSGRNYSQTQTDLASGLDGLGRRQTGSAFKPFTLVAAFRQGIPPTREYSSASPIDLSQECNGWMPSNAEGAGDSGFMDLYTATADSINVVFAQLARDVGPPNIARAAEDMGIPGDTLPQGGADCSITLGTGSVSPLDMATAYATLADDGMYCPYYAVERIVGPAGKTLYQH